MVRDLEVGELQAVGGRDHDDAIRSRAISPRATSFSSAASATPVCGQLNMPVRSARAAASASSSSVACSTTPSKRCSVRIGLVDRHRVADLDRRRERRLRRDRLELPVVLIRAVERVGRRGLRDDDARALGDEPELEHHVEAGAERADVAEVAARDDDHVRAPPSRTAARSRSTPSSGPRGAGCSSSSRGRRLLPRRAAGRSPCSRRSRCRARARARRWRAAARAARSRPCRAAGSRRRGCPAAAA